MIAPRLELVPSIEERTWDHEQIVSRAYSKWSMSISNVEWYRDERVFSWLDNITALAPRRVLEICCGSGAVLERLAVRLPGTMFDGVDISQAMYESARRRCSSLPNVRLFNGDWLSPVRSPEPYDVIIIKNSLHLIGHLFERLKELQRVCHSKTCLVIVETVSPSNESRRFVERLFRVVDKLHVKSHYFTKRTLTAALKNSGWTVQQDSKVVNQLMSVDKWLSFKAESQATRTQAIQVVLDAAREVREEMNITSDQRGVFMLRRQLLLFAVPTPKDA